MLHCLSLFYEAAWWLDGSYYVGACIFAYGFIIFQSYSNAGPLWIAPKKIKMFACTVF